MTSIPEQFIYQIMKQEIMANTAKSIVIETNYRVHSILQRPRDAAISTTKKTFSADDIAKLVPLKAGSNFDANQFARNVIELASGDTVLLIQLPKILSEAFQISLNGYAKDLQDKIEFLKIENQIFNQNQNQQAIYKLEQKQAEIIAMLQEYRKDAGYFKKFVGIVKSLSKLYDDFEGVEGLAEFTQGVEDLIDAASLGPEILGDVAPLAGPMTGFVLALVDLILVGADEAEADRRENYMEISITNSIPGTSLFTYINLDQLDGEMIDSSGNRITHVTVKALQAQNEVRAVMPDWPNDQNIVSDTLVMYFLPPAGTLSKIQGNLDLKLKNGDGLLLENDMSFFKTTTEELHDGAKAEYIFDNPSVGSGNGMRLGYNGKNGNPIPTYDPITKTNHSALTTYENKKVSVDMKLVLSDPSMSPSNNNYGYAANKVALGYRN